MGADKITPLMHGIRDEAKLILSWPEDWIVKVLWSGGKDISAIRDGLDRVIRGEDMAGYGPILTDDQVATHIAKMGDFCEVGTMLLSVLSREDVHGLADMLAQHLDHVDHFNEGADA